VIVATIDPIGKKELSKLDLGMTSNRSPAPPHPYVHWFGEAVARHDETRRGLLPHGATEKTARLPARRGSRSVRESKSYHEQSRARHRREVRSRALP
jgi:hypothetical protein